MSVVVFHGDDTFSSYQALSLQIAQLKNSETLVHKLDGKTLTSEEFLSLSNQEDFFIQDKILIINNLFSQPKSKKREHLIEEILTSQAQIFWWESKELTQANKKRLASVSKKYFPLKEKIWSLLASFSPRNNNSTFRQLFQDCREQYESFYLLAMFIWQIQQLLAMKEGVWRGAPFKKIPLERQAEKFTQQQLVDYHQKLIALEFSRKSGQLTIDLDQKLFSLVL